MFEQVVAALVHGSGDERIATVGCSDRTIRRRLHEWAAAGLAETLHRLVLEQYDRLIGLESGDRSVDGCLTKAPGGGAKAGRSPVDRGKPGRKRSTAVEAVGVPLHLVAAGANRHDAPLRAPPLEGVTKLGPLPEDVTTHLDWGYDGGPTWAVLDRFGFTDEIARKGIPAPLQAGKRWVVERTQSWKHGYGKLRRGTERDGAVIDFYLVLAAALVTVRSLIREARRRFRWQGRPTTRCLK